MAELEQLTTSPPPEVHSVDLQTEESSLVDDVIFGGEKGSVSEAFPDETEQAIVENSSTESESQVEPSVEVNPGNEEVRYQYWQSQADKLRNERDQLQTQFNTLAAQPQVQQQQEEPEAAPEPEFPAPPEKPQKPYNFSMDEALSDPSSESARFVQSEQVWLELCLIRVLLVLTTFGNYMHRIGAMAPLSNLRIHPLVSFNRLRGHSKYLLRWELCLLKRDRMRAL
jgi:hypothetical protein